eukprot:8632543-Lingulodinium_polyedra.AAC.1
MAIGLGLGLLGPGTSCQTHVKINKRLNISQTGLPLVPELLEDCLNLLFFQIPHLGGTPDSSTRHTSAGGGGLGLLLLDRPGH